MPQGNVLMAVETYSEKIIIIETAKNTVTGTSAGLIIYIGITKMPRMNTYSSLKNTWSVSENYEPRVTLSLNKWNQYVSEGKNTLYGGAIIPGGTVSLPMGGGGAVYSGTVRQGW